MRVKKKIKFRIAIPDTYDEAVEIYRINAIHIDTYWQYDKDK